MHLEINRRNIRSVRLADSSPPDDLSVDHVVLRLERAALTSNNVSYALSGDLLDYWGFFPTETGWGRLPVMGFGVVTASKHHDVAVGSRYFGFYPLGDHHVVHAKATKGGFSDASPWREKHAAAYRAFEIAQPTKDDDSILILRGLFLTSFLLEDFLREHDEFGAAQVIITSASSKTSIALAHCLQRFSDLDVVGITSKQNFDFTANLGEYDTVVSYDNVHALNRTESIVVDMAGNPGIVAEVHQTLAGLVTYSCSVGATHWDAQRVSPPEISPKPQFFFAPSQLAKRTKEWGRDEVNHRIAEALGIFIESSAQWMTIRHTSGGDEVMRLYDDLVGGRVEPSIGNIVSFG